jgi:hypothetical protein
MRSRHQRRTAATRVADAVNVSIVRRQMSASSTPSFHTLTDASRGTERMAVTRTSAAWNT